MSGVDWSGWVEKMARPENVTNELWSMFTSDFLRQAERINLLEEAMRDALKAPMIDHNDSRRSCYGILRAALENQS